MRLIGIDQQEGAGRRQVCRPPARNLRRASLDHRYGILVVRVTAKTCVAVKLALKKLTPETSEDRQKAVPSVRASKAEFDPVPCDLLTFTSPMTT